MTSNDGLEPARAAVRTAGRAAFSGPETASALTFTVEPQRRYGAGPVALPGSVGMAMKTKPTTSFSTPDWCSAQHSLPGESVTRS